MLDTVGFITDLPHGLVDSFKATLEEVHFADVLVHVRDISHPHTEHQKETVLKVLREIGISDEHLSDKCVEVWNKIDLVGDRDALDEQYLGALEAEISPIMLSCETGENKMQFLKEVGDLATGLMGKRKYRLQYPCEQHNKVLTWLHRNASITQEEDFEYIEDTITITVLLDEVTHQKYLKEFEPERFRNSSIRGRDALKGQRGMPPPGW